MKVAVFVSVQRRDSRVTTFSSIKEIENIEDKQQLDGCCCKAKIQT